MGLFDETEQEPTQQKRLFDPSYESDVLRTNAEISSKTTPDQAARLLDLEQKTGLPSSFIADNLEHVSRESEKRDFDADTFAKTSPLVTKWLSEHPNHYAAAKDDLANLSTLEWMIKAPQRAYEQGKLHKSLQDYRIFAATGGELSPEQEQEVLDLKKRMQKGDFAEQTFFGEALVGAAEHIPQLTAQHLRGATYAAPIAGAAGLAALVYPPAIPAIAAVATPAVGAAYYAGLGIEGYRMETAGAYDEFLDFRDAAGNPMDKNVARLAANAAGLLNMGLEMAQGRVLLKSIPGVEKILGKGIGRQVVSDALRSPTVMKALREMAVGYGKTLSSEALMEGVQRFITIISGEIAKTVVDPEFIHKTPKQILAETAEETKQAFTSFAYIVAPGHLARTTRNIDAARKAKTQQRFFEALGENTMESKLRERLPDKHQEIVAKMTKDGPLEQVYVSNEFFQQYWTEQGLEPEAIAEEMGISPQYQESIETGAKMAIPTSQYAKHIAGTEHNNAFAPELSVAVDMMNAREADEYLQAAEPDLEPAAMEESVARVREDVRSQLERIYPPDIAERQSRLYEARFRARAQRLGGDPWELYQQRPFTVGQEELPGGRIMEQGIVPLTDITVEMEAIEEETGKPMKVKESADVALKETNDNITKLQGLIECLG